MQLLTQNSDLKRTGIYGWTLPAHWVQLTDGKRFNTCPNAGICGAFCYAKSGTYQFSNVKKAHIEKLELVLNNRPEWIRMMNEEIAKPKYNGKYIRIHDAGDFFSIDYAVDWLNIAKQNPDVIFYTYTKEVDLFKNKIPSLIPSNFIVIYSYGGKQDHMIDPEVDRHSDVFYDYDKMIQEGYNDIGEDDKQAAIHPNHRVGLFRNNIPHFIKKQGDKKFSQWQSGDRPSKQSNVILLIGATGTGKTWVMTELIKKYQCNRRQKMGKVYFHRSEDMIIVGRYDGSMFQGSDKLSMSVITDLESLLKHAKGDMVLLEGDRFTNSKVIAKAKPTIIRINGDGEEGRSKRGSAQTERQIKSIFTRVHNIQLSKNDHEVENSTEALELIINIIQTKRNGNNNA